MNETEAVISTANATWALVWVTAILAFLTFLVVAAAIGVPLSQRWSDNERAKQRDAERDTEAEASVDRTKMLVDEIREYLSQKVPFDQFRLWALINRVHTQKRVVSYFLAPGMVGASMPYRLSAALQALDEVADAIQRALKISGNAIDHAALEAGRRQEGADTAGRALQRLEKALNPIA